MDRTEAIKLLEGWRDTAIRRRDAVSFDMAIAALREQEQSQWIGVKEKPMPSGNEEYEVCCDYHGEKRIEIHKGWNAHCVTHWRRLPEPPDGGAEGGGSD